MKMASQTMLRLFTAWFEALYGMSKLSKAMGSCSAHCKLLLFCAKTAVKDSCNLKKKERMKEEEEEEVTFWIGNFYEAFSCHCDSCWS